MRLSCMKLNAHDKTPEGSNHRGTGTKFNVDPLLTCGGIVFHGLLVIENFTTTQVGRSSGDDKHACIMN